MSNTALAVIERELSAGQIFISAISTWEIAMLVKQERLFLTMSIENWLATISKIPSLRFLPVDVEIAINSVTLHAEFHKDPADRIIVATARKLAAPLITKDQQIRDYGFVQTIW